MIPTRLSSAFLKGSPTLRLTVTPPHPRTGGRFQKSRMPNGGRRDEQRAPSELAAVIRSECNHCQGCLWQCSSRNRFMQPFGEFAKNLFATHPRGQASFGVPPRARGVGFQNLQTPSAFDGCESSFLNFSLRLCELTAELTHGLLATDETPMEHGSNKVRRTKSKSLRVSSVFHPWLKPSRCIKNVVASLASNCPRRGRNLPTISRTIGTRLHSAPHARIVG